jgi:preprotein translocase subunit SecG
MSIIGILLLIVFIIASLLLIVIVLLQDEQGEGIGGIFGGGSSTPFGSRSGNILTKFTSILGAVFFITTLGLAWINRTPDTGDVIGAARRNAPEQSETLEWWSDPAPSLEQGASEGGDLLAEPEATQTEQAAQ